MAETRTTRVGLPLWSAGTDSPSRADFNEGYTQIENLMAIDAQGPFSSRPSAGVRGRYYTATEDWTVYRDTGSAWVTVGKAVEDQVVKASAAASVAQTVRGYTAQTANLTDWRNASSTLLASVDKDGAIYTRERVQAGTNPPTTAVINAASKASDNIVMLARGYSTQAADLQQWQNSGGSVLAKVTKDGYVYGTRFYLTSGVQMDTIEPYMFYSVGAMSVVTGKHQMPLGTNYELVGITARLGTAPTGASAIIDVNYNGTTIFGTQANRPTFAAGSQNATVGAASVTSFSSGGYLTVDIDQVGSTVAGSDLVVVVRLRRTA